VPTAVGYEEDIVLSNEYEFCLIFNRGLIYNGWQPVEVWSNWKTCEMRERIGGKEGNGEGIYGGRVCGDTGSGRVGTVAAVRAGEGKRMGVGRGLRRATVETGSTIAL